MCNEMFLSEYIKHMFQQRHERRQKGEAGRKQKGDPWGGQHEDMTGSWGFEMEKEP